MEEGSHGFSSIQGGGYKVREVRRIDKMAKRKKPIATVNRKLGILISCRVHEPVLKDLDACRKSLKLSRSSALVKLRHRPPGRTEGASRKAVGRRRRHMFPAGKMTILNDHTALPQIWHIGPSVRISRRTAGLYRQGVR